MIRVTKYKTKSTDPIGNEIDVLVNAQWEKLSQAQTKEEIQEVLDTWPEKKSFEVEEEDDKISDSNEQPTVDK